MSRVFDALQRSGTEQSGVEYPDLMSMVTQVFEAPPQNPALAETTTERQPEQPALAHPEFAPRVLAAPAVERARFLTKPGGHAPSRTPAAEA